MYRRLPQTLFSFLRPSGEQLSPEAQRQVQFHRLLTLLGAVLVPLFGLLYDHTNPTAVDPAWVRLLVAGLFATLFLASYGSGLIRRHYVRETWAVLCVTMGWFAALATLNHFAPDFAVGFLLVFSVLTAAVGLGARSIRPVLWFAGFGFFLAVGGTALSPVPGTSPLIVLAGVGTIAIAELAVIQGRLSTWNELRRRQEQLATAQQIAGLGSWERDFGTGELYWSAETRRIFGWDPEERVTYERYMETVHPGDREALCRQQERLFEEGVPIDIEFRIVRPDGEERIVRERGTAEFDEDGDPIHALGTVLDVTEEREREEALREERDRRAALFENASDPVMEVRFEDRTPTIRQVNPAFEEVFGLGAEEATGLSVSEAVVPEPRRGKHDRIRDRVLQGERVEVEVRRETAEGEREFLLRVIPIESEGPSKEAYAWLTDITERKKRQEELRRRERQLEQIRENVTDVVWMSTPDKDTMEFISKAYEEVWGRTTTELKEDPMSFLEGVHPEDRERVRSALEVQQENPEAYAETYRVVKPNGEVRWVQDRAAGVYDEEGRIQRIIGVATDVTEQKEIQRKLERSKQRYQTLAEHFPNGAVGVYDHNLRYTLAEGALLGEVLPSSDRLEASRMPEVFPEETIADIEPLFRAAVADGATGSVETSFGGRDWRVWATPLRDPEGEIFAGLSFAQDITDQKQREEALRERQEKIEALYAATDQLLRAEDKEAVATAILDLVNEVFGYLVGVRFFEDGQLVPVQLSPEIPEQVPPRPSFDVEGESVVARAFREGKTVAFDDLRTADDPFDYGEVRAAAIVPIGKHGTISVGDLEVGAINAFDRRLIEVLAAHATVVFDRIERQQELLEAKEVAEEASRLKSTMLTNMSHEIRTPLTSITGFAELLTEELDGRLEEFASRIHESGQRLMKTLDSVLQLSKLEAGTQTLEREEVDLALLAEETAEMLRPSAAEKSITLDSDVPGTGVKGAWYEGALNRIVENLVENAIKFTPEGGRVVVRVWEEGGKAALEIEDTGVGISEESLSEIFEAFKQESEGLSRDYEGSGLGLAIVKELVEVHGGTIEVESEKGEGTCFTVWLPRADDLEEA